MRERLEQFAGGDAMIHVVADPGLQAVGDTDRQAVRPGSGTLVDPSGRQRERIERIAAVGAGLL